MAFSRNLAIWVALAALASAATPAQAGDVKRGAQLYNFCAQCHGADGAGNELYLAPNLTGLPDWHLRSQLRSFWTGLRGLHPDDVAGLRMYPMAKTFNGERAESDIEAVSAYIATLPVQVPAPTLVGGDPERGASFYQVCVACHGADGQGNEALNSPPLTQQSDWYMLSSLQRYKAGVRGYDQRNANAQIMRGMAATLTDEQAMKDVIAYIRSLGGAQAATQAD